MFKTYEEAINWIHTRRGMGPKPGIRRMEWMMAKLNHPEQAFPAIHIAGTNGKGSTVAYLTSLFLASGHSVGSFTSPHIMKFNERISFNGTPIADETVRELANQIQPLYEEIRKTELGGLTEFEVVTSMMFLYFSKTQPDVVLLEVGLGGLFDSTNVVRPRLSVITTIGLDHVKILGGTVEEIAYQKAGIIKKEVPVILGKIESPAKDTIEQIAKEKKAPLERLGETFMAIHHPNKKDFYERFDYSDPGLMLKDLEIHLMGHHQVENAATALHAFHVYCKLEKLAYTEDTIRLGLKQAFWPVRMEIISKEPFIMLDGAHNEPAIIALEKTLRENFAGKNIKILYASLTTKDLEKIGEWLVKIPNSDIHLTTFDFPQVATLSDLKERLNIKDASYHENWQAALMEMRDGLGTNDVLLVTGSLYFLSEVRKHLVKEK